MSSLLDVVALHKSFGPVSVLRGADLSLQAGEVLALVGDNGAGKSTLIKHVAGVHRADSGEIRLNGVPLDLHSPADARALGIETVYQDLALADDLSVGANVFLGREPIRRWFGLPVIDNRRIRDETESLLARIESRIPPKAAHRVASFRRPASGGGDRAGALLAIQGGDPRRADRGARRDGA